MCYNCRIIVNMGHFLVFRRSAGHCYCDLVNASDLSAALVNYVVEEHGAEALGSSGLVRFQGREYHALELIEWWDKADRKYDELQEDDHGNLLNHKSWEILEIHPKALEQSIASFCTAEPASVTGYIELCRKVFRKGHPRSRAKAFLWYLYDGQLITFHSVMDRDMNHPPAILGRYLLRNQKHLYPQPYVPTEDMVEEWTGTYDDLVSQLMVRRRF